MLEQELLGRSFVKRKYNERLQKLLNGRSIAAIEYKHRNISAVLDELDFPSIAGYKSLDHFQGILADEVAMQLERAESLLALAGRAVVASAAPPRPIRSVEDVFVPVPAADKKSSQVYEAPQRTYTPILGKNYLRLEAANASLGSAGEKFVLEVEHKRLWEMGLRHLAERIEHVSRVRGDGLGYDIASFEENGEERFIEVKTTRYGPLTPFYASSREVLVSRELAPRYSLYRLFKFESKPRIFVLPGAITASCVLEPMQFRARPR